MPIPNFPRHPRLDVGSAVESIRIAYRFEERVTRDNLASVKKDKAIKPFRRCLGSLFFHTSQY